MISTSSADGHDHVGYYGIGEYVYAGPEIAWELVTDRTETATISVSGHRADVDLFVLGSSACDATDAIAQSGHIPRGLGLDTEGRPRRGG